MTDKIIEKDISKASEQNAIVYSMSLMMSRALSDVRDGFLPVERRIMIALNKLGAYSSKPYRKMTKVIGDTMGDFHPHGDSSIENAAVKLAADYRSNIPLIDGHGNYGNISGDRHAAPRYIECRLKKIAEDYILEDLDKNSVDIGRNYDGTLDEPTVLPAAFPNILVNGSFGIAVGWIGSIPPHNLKEVCDYTIKYIDGTLKDTDFLYPDFPTGGVIPYGHEVKDAYRKREQIEDSDNRSFKVIGKTRIDGHSIVIESVPYGTTVGGIRTALTEAIKDGLIEGITGIEDYSNKDNPVQLVVDVKPNANPGSILKKIYKHTTLRHFYKVSFTCVNGEKFRSDYDINSILEEWVKFRFDTVCRILNYDLNKNKINAHIKEGIRTVINDIDNAIAIIKKSKDNNESRDKLVAKYNLTPIQADKILEIKISSLNRMNKTKLTEEIDFLNAEVERLNGILSDKNNIYGIIKKELKEISKLSVPRKTEVKFMAYETKDDEEEEIVKAIPEGKNVLMLTNNNFLKRMPGDITRIQGRNGKGKSFGKMKEGDFVKDILIVDNKDYLGMVTSKGKIYNLQAFSIDECKLETLGKDASNFLNLDGDEKVVSIIPMDSIKKAKGKYLTFFMKSGLAKRVKVEEFSNIGLSGLICSKLRDNDTIVSCVVTSDKDNEDLFAVTKKGIGIRVSQSEVPDILRPTYGSGFIKLDADDEVVSGLKIEKEFLFLLSNSGYGKRIEFSTFTNQQRYGKGKMVISFRDDKKEFLVQGVNANVDDEALIVSRKNLIGIRIADVPVYLRPAKGLGIFKLEAKDQVAGMTIL